MKGNAILGPLFQEYARLRKWNLIFSWHCKWNIVMICRFLPFIFIESCDILIGVVIRNARFNYCLYTDNLILCIPGMLIRCNSKYCLCHFSLDKLHMYLDFRESIIHNFEFLWFPRKINKVYNMLKQKIGIIFYSWNCQDDKSDSSTVCCMKNQLTFERRWWWYQTNRHSPGIRTCYRNIRNVEVQHEKHQTTTHCRGLRYHQPFFYYL